MKHTASARFWRSFEKLPAEIQTLAKRNYSLLRADPSHPSLQFKAIGGGRMYSVRVGLHYRALGDLLRAECIGSGSEAMVSTTNSSANMSIDTDVLSAGFAGLLSAGQLRLQGLPPAKQVALPAFGGHFQ